MIKKLFIVLVLGVGCALCFLTYLWFSTPDVRWLRHQNPEKTALMKLREEAKTTRVNYKLRYTFVSLSKISKNLQNAVVASENYSFYENRGIDWKSIRYSVGLAFRYKKIVRGGSTITQQLAKNIFLSPQRTFMRKIKEAIIAIKLEQSLTKSRILELYLNCVEWGNGLFGAQQAAEEFFQIPASDLDVEQSIRIATILPNPFKLSPYDTSVELNAKRQQVAQIMFNRGFIDKKTLSAVIKSFSSK